MRLPRAWPASERLWKHSRNHSNACTKTSLFEVSQRRVQRASLRASLFLIARNST